MQIYTVRLNGRPVKQFVDHNEASLFMKNLQIDQLEKAKQLDYIDAAVLLSDMKDSKELIKYIMEK
jgi:hypothetical protein